MTSPTPYDPPLTYGGWKQSQALGARIASIIQFRENAGDDLNISGDSSDSSTRSSSRRGRRRKHRVIVHSSPYLRCIQTSIAISAGLRQYDPNTDSQGSSSGSGLHINPHAFHSGDPQFRQSPRLSAIPEPPSENTFGKRRDIPPNPLKDPRAWLRVDAFLSEWLSPSYFEDITPPPSSKLMVASAKSELLRRSEPVNGIEMSHHKESGIGNFPGGWGGGSRTPTLEPSRSAVDETPLNDLSSLDQALPKLSRAHSHHLGNTPSIKFPNRLTRLGSHQSKEHPRYEAPTPSYAISPLQPIPRGYVTHARDACVNVDYQWDSMRPPHEWGDGGDYGEEWSSMHKRFRRGLNGMVEWYRGRHLSQKPQSKDDKSSGDQENRSPSSHGYDEDDDADIVLVLVTHSAGCNALIGALSNQPVLIDVSMASLTMAVRKRKDYRRISSPDGFRPDLQRRRRSLADTTMLEDYEIKLMASTDHLRAGSRFMANPRSQRAPSLPVRDKSPYRYERHVLSPQHHPINSSPVREMLHSKPARPAPSTNTSNTSITTHHTHESPPTFTTYPTTITSGTPTTTTKSSGLWSLPTLPSPPARTSSSPIDFGSASASSPITTTTTADRRTSSSSGISPHGSPTQEKTLSSLQEQHLAPSLDGTHRRLLDPDRDRAASGSVSVSVSVSANGDANSPTADLITPMGLWGTAPKALATERDKGAKRRWTLGQA